MFNVITFHRDPQERPDGEERKRYAYSCFDTLYFVCNIFVSVNCSSNIFV